MLPLPSILNMSQCIKMYWNEIYSLTAYHITKQWLLTTCFPRLFLRYFIRGFHVTFNFSFQGLAHFLQSTPWVCNVQFIQHYWKILGVVWFCWVFPQPIRLTPRPSICPYQGQCIAPKGKRGLIEILLSSFQTYWVARKFLCNNKHCFILKCLGIFFQCGHNCVFGPISIFLLTLPLFASYQSQV